MEVRAVRDLSDEGTILFVGPGGFEVIIAEKPGMSCDQREHMLYGIYNTATGIVEAYTSSFAQAKELTENFDKENREGFSTVNGGGLLASLLLKGSGSSTPPSLGGLN